MASTNNIRASDAPPSPAVVVYTDDVAALAIGSEPDPFSGRTSANDDVAKLT